MSVSFINDSCVEYIIIMYQGLTPQFLLLLINWMSHLHGVQRLVPIAFGTIGNKSACTYVLCR